MKLRNLFIFIAAIATCTPHLQVIAGEVQIEPTATQSAEHPLCTELQTILHNAWETAIDATPVTTPTLKERMEQFKKKLVEQKPDMQTMQQLIRIWKDECAKMSRYDTEIIEDLILLDILLMSCTTSAAAYSTINAFALAIPQEVTVTQCMKTALWATIAYFMGKFTLFTGKHVVNSVKDLKFYINRYRKEKALYNQAQELEKNIDAYLQATSV